MSEERSLALYQRGRTWWVRGRRPDNDRYVRESLGTPDEAVAEAKLEEIYRTARNRRILGPDAPKPEDELTFAAAVLLYDATPQEATYLKPLVRRYGRMRVKEMTGAFIRSEAKRLMPYASTDTWQRQVITPIRSVINKAHGLGKAPPLRVQSFTREERVKQDGLRRKESRVPKQAGSWPWLLAFCEAADPKDAALAYFMFRHGYRLSQSLAMTRSKDMNLSIARVRVHASKGHPAHWVQLDPEEVAMIANLPLPYRGKARDRVFGIGGGRSGALYRRWKDTCERAGIAYLPPHSSGRHGYATEMIVRQRVDPATAADKLWADPSVMLKTYSHTEEAQAVVREAFRVGRTQAVQPKTGKAGKALRGKAK